MKSIIFLYGPPGSGKSTLGGLLAESLGLPFADLDQVIEVAVAKEAAIEPPRPRKRSDDTAEGRSDEASDKD